MMMMQPCDAITSIWLKICAESFQHLDESPEGSFEDRKSDPTFYYHCVPNKVASEVVFSVYVLCLCVNLGLMT